MSWFGNLIKFCVFKSLQYLWTSVTLFNLLKERIQYGKQYFARTLHPKPECLDGWDSRFIQLKSVKLHYVQTGSDDKPLMLMIHGFPEFWYSYRYQLRHFESNYRCVAFDQRGYNLSEKPKEVDAYNVNLLADDVRQIIEKLGYKKAVVIGHDWGAAVAWRTAMMFPEVVEKLIILNVPHPRAFSSGGLGQLLKSWYIFMFQSAYVPELAVSANNFRMLSLMFRGKKGGLRNRKNFTDDDLAAWKHVFSQEGALTPPINYYRCIPRTTNLSREQSIIQPPTLVIWGTEDAFLSKESAMNSMKFCRDGRVQYIEGASHWVQQDEPEQVNQYIEKFLTEEHGTPTSSDDSSKI